MVSCEKAGFACAYACLTRGFVPRYCTESEKDFWHLGSKQTIIEIAMPWPYGLYKQIFEHDLGMCMRQIGCFLWPQKHAWQMRGFGNNKECSTLMGINNRALRSRLLRSIATRKREAFYILCPASSLMDVPGYVNADKLMNVPIGFVCR